MTPKELMSRIKTLISEIAWTGTTYIFGINTFVTPDFPITNIAEIIAPSCFIVDMGQKSHPEHEGIIEQSFNIMFFVENLGDNKGEGEILGGNRIANTSVGAGIYDIEQKIITTIRDTITLSTAVVTLEGSGRIKLNKAKGNEPLVIRILRFKARVYIY